MTAAAADIGLLAFASSVIASVAWPLAATVIAFGFRRQLGAMIGRVQELAFGDAKISLGKDVAKMEGLAEIVAETSSTLGPPVTVRAVGRASGTSTASAVSAIDPFESLVEISPSAAIVHQHLLVESALSDLTTALGWPARDAPIVYLTRLEAEGTIPHDLAALLRQMREIRDRAAHGKTGANEARQYKLAATIATGGLRSIKSKIEWEAKSGPRVSPEASVPTV